MTSIMASLAFGTPVDFAQAHVEGITALAAPDIGDAERLGDRIKLLGIAKRAANGIELRVHPTLVPVKRLLANVEGSMNAIMVKSDAAGITLYYGAGSEQTASAVIADLIDIARLDQAPARHHIAAQGFHLDAMAALPVSPIGDIETSYYLRLRVKDEPGGLTAVTRILADAGISIDAMLQQEAAIGASETDLVLLTHVARERIVRAALTAIEALPTVLAPLTSIRMETLT